MPFERSSFSQRDPFGRLKREQGDEFQKLRDRPFTQSARSLSNLRGNVGRHETNNRSDVARVETLMACEDKYDIRRTDGPTGIFSVGLENAIKDYQEDKGLKRDGLITPRGETIASMIKIERLDSDGGEGDEGDDETPEGPPAPPPEAPPEDTPEDPPKDPPEDPEDPDHDCSDLEVALANAESILEQHQSELDAAESQLDPLESELDSVELEIEQLQEEREKIEILARGVGVASGALAGGLGSVVITKNPYSFAPGAAIGGERGDALAEAGLKTLDFEMAEPEQKRSELLAEIEPIRALVGQLQPAVSEAEALVSEAQRALEACQNSQ